MADLLREFSFWYWLSTKPQVESIDSGQPRNVDDIDGSVVVVDDVDVDVTVTGAVDAAGDIAESSGRCVESDDVLLPNINLALNTIYRSNHNRPTEVKDYTIHLKSDQNQSRKKFMHLGIYACMYVFIHVYICTVFM